jgi:hypothetical protein
MLEAMDTQLDDDDVMRRALAAYFRGGATTQPNSGESGVQLIGDRRYVVLRNSDGLLAIYRVRNDGMLKRMKRWPKELEPSL